jgi:acetoin utilization protein AcuB
MLAGELINHEIPKLQLKDTVGKALQLINDFKVSHLPVVSGKQYVGLISEDDLLDIEGTKSSIEALQENFITAVIEEHQYFLNAVSFINQMETTIVPIVNKEKELLGVVTTTDLLKALGNFSGANEIGGIVVLEMKRSQFSISEISRLVESNDATILHLNTTVNAETGLLTVTLHLNKKEIAAVIATFHRYEYYIVYSHGDENFETDIQNNFRHLMNYLHI